MARLEDLFQRFLLMPEEEQEFFVREYRTKRNADIESAASIRRSPSKRVSTTPATEEEKLLMKVLKLSLKDIRTLQNLNIQKGEEGDTENGESDDDGLVLFE